MGFDGNKQNTDICTPNFFYLLHNISVFMQGSMVHLVILANHNSIIQKALRWSDGGSRDPGSLLLFA